MPVSVDYHCWTCGHTVVHHAHQPVPEQIAVIHDTAAQERCPSGTLNRIWTAPHMGPGSNGEPSR